jgi:sugar phosphate isomerase/epimerase
MASISYQLYCSRNFPPLGDTLAMLATTGFKSVEGYGGLYSDIDGLTEALNKTGLNMPTGHFALSMVEDDPNGAIAIARRLGMSAMIVPYIMPDDRPADAAGWAAFGHRLAEASKPVLDAGLAFGWHNHDFEFDNLGGDELPIDLIAQGSPDISIELDLGWVRVAGHDPVAWINKLSQRLVAVHIKDIAPDGENTDEDGWADVGHGIIDWAPIKVALDHAGVTRYVLEHDNPSNHARFAARSLASVLAW